MTFQERLTLMCAIDKAKTYKMNFVDEDDLKVIKYVSKVLDTFKMEPATVKNRMTLNEAKIESIKLLELFGGDIASRAESLLNKTSILEVHPLPFIYSCNIKFDLDQNDEVLKNSGRFLDVKVPSVMDTSAPVLLGHECIHLLKETNYEEYVDAFVYSDVIPLFFELVKMNDVESPKVLFAERMHLLLTDKVNFDEYTRRIEYNDFDKELYEYSQTRAGEYLNSFYYAIVLFKMYKENKKDILNYIKLVLNHKITTRELLSILGIYKNMDCRDIFESEFNKVRSI